MHGRRRKGIRYTVLGTVFTLIQVSLSRQSDIDSKFGLQTPDVVLSVQRTCLSIKSVSAIEGFFMGIKFY